MRILLYPHSMEIGGSQLNALHLAGAVRDRGHEVLVVSEDGPLVQLVSELGLEHLPIPPDRRRLSPAVLGRLVEIVRRRRIDVVHGYEWPPVVEACFGPGVRCKTPVVGTVMSMSVVPFFPRTIPLVVGTELIAETARAAAHRRVTVIEPPVDTDADHPSLDGSGFRARHGIEPDEVLIAMICRLVPELKLEGLLGACDAVGELARSGHRVRLAIVGDGRARGQVAARAAKAAAAAGREVVVMTGEIRHPGPAYAAADVILGQGGSALRGMGFGKPLVVIGEGGFSELLTLDTAPLFLYQGWYGSGPGSRGSGVPALRDALEGLIVSASAREELGALGRRMAVERFDLRRAARVQELEYRAALTEPIARSKLIADLARCAAGLASSKVQRTYQRRRGTVTVDDANAHPQTAPPGRLSATR